MVDEAGEVAVASSVDDGVTVDAEQVAAADADGFVALLAEVGDRLTHHLTDVLYHHLSLGDRLQRKEAPVMDATLRKFQLLLSKLRDRHGQKV